MTRALQFSLFQKYKNLKKSQITYLKKIKNITNFAKKRKKCYHLSFPILGGRDCTRALQSTPLQNPRGGGSPERDGGGEGRTNKGNPRV